ncbi:carbohydrate-binding protein [Reichenbachiella sp.]|uniref:carbohydrate-binding protein n=1 Tax=Reichenbachiella sp. TaxID=2184521 RepID=UPI003BB05D70
MEVISEVHLIGAFEMASFLFTQKQNIMMRKILLTLILAICHLGGVRAQDWTNIPVPADAGSGKTWELQANVSDDFNYNFNSSSHSNFGSGNKWYNFYHNTWDGPGYTYWKHSNVTVDGSDLVINVGYTSENSKGGSYGVVSGCVTSNAKVQYPVYVESAISVANISLASCFWLLSPDDTEEIDIIENYGGVNGYKHLTHISHHSFVRSPFTDYQPRDWNSWYPDSRVSTSYGWGDWCYNNGNRRYMRMGVYWISPKHFEYYIDGELVRVMYYNAIATKYNGTWQYTYFNSMNWNVNGYNLPTNNGSGYTDVTTHATSSTYNFATLQAASNASNGYNVIDPAWFQGGDDSDEDGNGVTVEARGFTKELDIIINMESQSWLAGSTPSASDLGNPAKNQMKVDWVRVYKPVQGSNHVAVTGVNLSPATLNLEVGDTGNVTGAVTPSNATDQTMTFTSSDTNVATVNQSGLVSAVSAGSATITATTTDGAFTDTSQITVTNPSSGGSGGAIVIEAENFGSTGGTYNDGFVPFGANNAGTKINYVNAGDWTEYAINVSSAGLYDLQYMISTPMTNAQVTLQVNGTSVATDNVPNNGQWDDYTSLNSATQVNLPAGAVTIRVLASGSNAWQWNLDKITLSESSSTPPPSNEVSLTIQAEDFASTGGTYNDGVVPFGANDNGSSINFVNGGDWMNYNVTIPEAGTYTVTYYISTPLSGTSIEMQVGSSYHMTTVPNNGGWRVIKRCRPVRQYTLQQAIMWCSSKAEPQIGSGTWIDLPYINRVVVQDFATKVLLRRYLPLTF